MGRSTLGRGPRLRAVGVVRDVGVHGSDRLTGLAPVRRDRVHDPFRAARLVPSHGRPDHAQPGEAPGRRAPNGGLVDESRRSGRFRDPARATGRRRVRQLDPRPVRHRVVGPARRRRECAGRVRNPSRLLLRGRPQRDRREGRGRERHGREAARRRLRAHEQAAAPVSGDSVDCPRHGRDPRRDGRRDDRLPRVLLRHVHRRAVRGPVPDPSSRDGARRRDRSGRSVRRRDHSPSRRFRALTRRIPRLVS